MTVPNDASDADLAARAAAGEERAFSRLMGRHKAGLFAFARRHTGEADAALDVVQETFVSAWGALQRYDRSRPFGVWLRAIALNKCRDRGRRMAVRRLILGAASLDAPAARAVAASEPAADVQLENAELKARLDQAIAGLPARLKEPLILSYFEDMSHAEAGKVLGLSVKAVEMRLYRARLRLAEILENDGISEG